MGLRPLHRGDHYDRAVPHAPVSSVSVGDSAPRVTDWPSRLAVVAGGGYLVVLGLAMTRGVVRRVGRPRDRSVDRRGHDPDSSFGSSADADPWTLSDRHRRTVRQARRSHVYYWASFDAFTGGVDARRYHAEGRLIASAIRDGTVSLLDALPQSQGTPFIDELTGLVYAVFGSSMLAGFMLYACMAYWGAVLYVRAAMIAVPGLAERQYAALVMLLPSIVLWSSATGKEAPMMLCLGLMSYGFARLAAGRWAGWSIPVIVIGAYPAATIRPHFVAMWIGAMVLALIGKAVVGGVDTGASKRLGGGLRRRPGADRIGHRCAGHTAVPRSVRSRRRGRGVVRSVTTIFDEVEENTTTGGSSIKPVSIDGPQDWPEAVVRTLSRPLPHEARSFAEMLPAAETTLLLVLAAINWRRLANLPRMLLRNPYVVFAGGARRVRPCVGNLREPGAARQAAVAGRTAARLLLICLPARAASTRDQSSAKTDTSEPALSRPTV